MIASLTSLDEDTQISIDGWHELFVKFVNEFVAAADVGEADMVGGGQWRRELSELWLDALCVPEDDKYRLPFLNRTEDILWEVQQSLDAVPDTEWPAWRSERIAATLAEFEAIDPDVTDDTFSSVITMWTFDCARWPGREPDYLGQ